MAPGIKQAAADAKMARGDGNVGAADNFSSGSNVVTGKRRDVTSATGSL